MRRAALLLLCALRPSGCSDDLYDLLGLHEASTAAEVKKAYRKASLRHHPDKGGDVAMFKRVSEAYEVLGDADKRALYDVGGLAAVAKGVGGTDPWGRPTGIQKDRETKVSVHVPLEDVYRGGAVRAKVRRRVVCRGCKAAGQGGWFGAGLPARCEGCGPSCPSTTKTVHRRMGHMIMQERVEVPSDEQCREDVGVLAATVERGAADGAEIRFARAGEQTPGRIPGDVVLKIRAARHAVFARNGTDLSMRLKVPLRDALLGFERTIRHLDGHDVPIRQPGVSTAGQVLTLPNEGMPVHGVPSEFGVLRVTLDVEMPEALSADERAFVAAHFEPRAKSEVPAGRYY